MNAFMNALKRFFFELKRRLSPSNSVKLGPNVSEDDFYQLSIRQRYFLMKNHGQFIEERIYRGFKIYLFLYNDYWVEVWQRIGIADYPFIEIADAETTLEKYSKIDPSKFLKNDNNEQ